MKPINYGMFIMPYHAPDKPLSQGYDEDLELVARAEGLGFDEFWIGEHHTMKYETIVMPEIFIGRALGETKRIRMGPAPVCLNQHHPAHVASRLAFLDHLAKGRLNLCFGPGSVTADQELYGVDPKAGGSMTSEAIDVILKLWSTDPPYEHKGKHWQFQLKDSVDEETLIGFIHKPYQEPHPPIAVPGMSRNSFSLRVAGQRGFQPFSHCLVAGNVLADNWRVYAEGAQAAGRAADRSDWKVTRSIFLADTTAEAAALARRNSPGAKLRVYRPALRQGAGAAALQAGFGNAGCRLQYGFSDGRADHCRRCRRGLAPAVVAHRGNRPLWHPNTDELRLGRQGPLAAQHGAVCQRADAGAQQGGGRGWGLGKNKKP